MKVTRFLLATLVVLGATGQAQGAVILTQYFDQASFLAAAGPGLAFEDFEGFGGTVLYEPLDTNTDFPPISPGDIPPGITFTTDGSGGLFIAPAGFAPMITSDAIFGNSYYSRLFVDFAPGINAVGSDVLSWTQPSTLRLTVLDEFSQINVIDIATPAPGIGYLGLIASGGNIVRLEYTPGSLTVGIDNIHFGTAVAEPGTLTLLILGLLGSGLVTRQRH